MCCKQSPVNFIKMTHPPPIAEGAHDNLSEDRIFTASCVRTIWLTDLVTTLLTRSSSLFGMRCLCPDNTHPRFCDQPPRPFPQLLLPFLFTLRDITNDYCIIALCEMHWKILIQFSLSGIIILWQREQFLSMGYYSDLVWGYACFDHLESYPIYTPLQSFSAPFPISTSLLCFSAPFPIST
jgi:hypothetical protein